MSRQAIAAVLARDDPASGERLVALSLASFADRENRAWPGAPAAAAGPDCAAVGTWKHESSSLPAAWSSWTSAPAAAGDRAWSHWLLPGRPVMGRRD